MQIAAVVVGALILSAGPDDTVEWGGVSHVDFQDRRPLAPVGGEAFDVRIRVYRNDITGMRVVVDDGTGVTTNEGVWVENRDAFDIWSAPVPATAQSSLTYHIEVTDGTDTDYYGTGGMSEDLPVSPFEIDYGTLLHIPVGATPTSDGGATFKVWAPNATSAAVRGPFNNWGANGTAMANLGGGYWVAYVPNVAPRANYKYFFNGSKWTPDARARGLNAADNQNSIVENPLGYQWQVTDFDTPDFEEMVIYQLHVGTFAGRNDPYGFAPIPSRYVDVANRVDHLVELGVNVVQLQPITEFPFDFSAGYNPISQYAPEWKYGTPDDFKAMIDTLHANGIAVTLDVVWNHFSGSDNYLWNYDGTQIYFDTPTPVGTPWGDQADFDRPEVRDYFIHSMMMWLEEYRLDGFRFDGTDFMNMGSHDASGWALMREANDMIDWRWPNKISYAEQLPDDVAVTRPTNAGFGAGFDAQYYDNFTDRLREQVLAASFGDPSMTTLASLIQNSEPYLSGTKTVNYVELHDEVWPSSGGERLVRTIDGSPPHDDQYAKGRTKLAQGFTMFAPGIPAMYQGSEWLESTNFEGSASNGSDRIDWGKKTTYSGIFEYYKAIIGLRTSNAAFRSDSPQQVFHFNEGGNVIGWQRYSAGGDVFVVLANFSNNDYGNYQIGIPQPGTWGEVVNSQDPAFEGDGPVNSATFQADEIPYDGFPWSERIVVPAMGLLVLQWNPPAECAADIDNNTVVDSLDLLAFLGDWFQDNADFNNSGGTDVNDLLDYLTLWFAGC